MTVELADVPTRSATLPAWSSVLAVVAHPDDESFGLGAILDAFARAGATVSVLCLTQGEASTVHGIRGDLRALRARELESAAATLSLAAATLAHHPDGALGSVRRSTLAAEVVDAVRASDAHGMVVFDSTGVTGHGDHAAASAAALSAAASLSLPVLGWTIPTTVAEQLNEEYGTSFIGHETAEVDLVVPVARERQRLAALAHASQAVPTSILWRRLELLGDVEHLRWLRTVDPAARVSPTTVGVNEPPAVSPSASGVPATATGLDAGVETLRVDYRDGDRFDIGIREHVVTVDQPVDAGGDDAGPTPTEMFVAALASCVAFYARRYLRRHKLDAAGLRVETSYRLGTKPARVVEVDMQIRLPQELPPARREALLAVARHCTVHNSITTAPQITVDLAADPSSPAH